MTRSLQTLAALTMLLGLFLLTFTIAVTLFSKVSDTPSEQNFLQEEHDYQITNSFAYRNRDNAEQVASNFRKLSSLSRKQQLLIKNFFKTNSTLKAAEMWETFTRQHNMEAATFLANTNAMSKVTLEIGDGKKINALDMLTSVTSLKDDRIFGRLDRKLFDEWQKAGGKYFATIKGKIERGAVTFNEGGMFYGGSVHKDENGMKFDVQGHTEGTPRIQWQYRYADGQTDIDIDYRTLDHLTHDNSVVTKNYDSYLKTFGYPGFDMREHV